MADISVIDKGAVGDGVTDCTAAFQKALDEAGKANGGVVTVPAGKFRINGNLEIPTAVTLEGTYRTAPQPGLQNPAQNTSDLQGSVLLAYAGRGSNEGKPFIKLAGDSATLKGIIVYYPEWKQTDVPPVPYPPCVQAGSWTCNTAVIDCALVNPYEMIRLDGAHRHLIRNVVGYPSWRGIYVDQCYDIGRIENVHIWPFQVVYKADDPYCKWVNLNGTAFEFARTDWEYVTNTFCFGYGVGYKFSESKSGSCNGNFLGIGADCSRRAVLIDQVQMQGIAITNGEFVGRWESKDSVTMEIGERVAGKVSLSNCAFWGPIDRCVWMKSPNGQFSASASNFCTWDEGKQNKPAIDLEAGKAIINASTFGEGSLHVRVGDKVRSAIISDNLADDGLVVDNRAGKKAIIRDNEESFSTLDGDSKLHYRVDVGASGDFRFLKNWHMREPLPADPEQTDFSMRWSAPSARILLPVAPGKAYTVSINASVPSESLSPDAGIYLDGKRLVSIKKTGDSVITVPIPAGKAGLLDLEVRVKNWSPTETGGTDFRIFGIFVRTITVKANGTKAPLYDISTGETR